LLIQIVLGGDLYLLIQIALGGDLYLLIQIVLGGDLYLLIQIVLGGDLYLSIQIGVRWRPIFIYTYLICNFLDCIYLNLLPSMFYHIKNYFIFRNKDNNYSEVQHPEYACFFEKGPFSQSNYIRWYIYGHSHMTHNRVSSDLQSRDISIKGEQWEILF
jgi:hypothetical protein